MGCWHAYLQSEGEWELGTTGTLQYMLLYCGLNNLPSSEAQQGNWESVIA